MGCSRPSTGSMSTVTSLPVRPDGRVRWRCSVRDRRCCRRLGRPSFTLTTAEASASVGLPFVGAHQAMNAAAATAAALAAGVTLEAAAAALSTATLSKWRMGLRDVAGGVTLLNDSYNANPDSTRAALDALATIEGGRRIAVLGEMLELGHASEAEHRAIGEYAARVADVVVAVGESAAPIADGARARAVALADNDAAIGWLRHTLADSDVVLVKALRGARLDQVATRSGSGRRGAGCPTTHISRCRCSCAGAKKRSATDGPE